MKSVKETKRPHKRFLHDVVGVRRVAGQPSRKVIRRVEMRQKDLFKLGPIHYTGPRSTCWLAAYHIQTNQLSVLFRTKI
jgi:hypothetical protein